MDPKEDVLVLYSTSHGIPTGITYHDGDEGYGVLTPARLAALLDELGIRNRLLILSACYSGVFVPAVWSDTTALVTAASAGRTSFGCAADNDWTFFGDAMINRALRKPQPLAAASEEALRLIGGWEAGKNYEPSYPQVSIGSRVEAWLKPLEARMPKTRRSRSKRGGKARRRGETPLPLFAGDQPGLEDPEGPAFGAGELGGQAGGAKAFGSAEARARIPAAVTRASVWWSFGSKRSRAGRLPSAGARD
jgi:hypothetical protein